MTDPEILRTQPKHDRTVSLYGYLRGTNIKSHQAVHLAGVGDFAVKSLAFLPDPCPLPDGVKKRTLVEKDKTIFAPMSGVGGVVYDKDAVYIDLGGSHAHEKPDDEDDLVRNIIQTESTLNEKLRESEMRIFSNSKPMKSSDIKSSSDDRARRKAIFLNELEREEDTDDSDDDDSENVRDNDDDDPPPTKKLKMNENSTLSINQQLLKDLDDDIGGSDEEDLDFAAAPNDNEEAQKSNKSCSRSLATEKDVKIGSKIAEALSNIKESDDESGDSSEDEEDDSDEEDDIGQEEEDQQHSSDDGFFDDKSDDEGEESLKWKTDLAMKARDSFYARQSGTSSLRKLVYGVIDKAGDAGASDDEDEIGGLFKVSSSKNVTKKELNGVDCSLWRIDHIQVNIDL